MNSLGLYNRVITANMINHHPLGDINQEVIRYFLQLCPYCGKQNNPHLPKKEDEWGIFSSIKCKFCECQSTIKVADDPFGRIKINNPMLIYSKP
jgi:hypothetical protein